MGLTTPASLGTELSTPQGKTKGNESEATNNSPKTTEKLVGFIAIIMLEEFIEDSL